MPKMILVTCDLNKPPLGGLLTIEYLNVMHQKEIGTNWNERAVTEIKIDNQPERTCATSNDLCRMLARFYTGVQLYGTNAVEQTEVDHWLSYAIGPLNSRHDFKRTIDYLDQTLSVRTYFVAKHLTIADFAVFAAIYVNNDWRLLLSKNEAPVHVFRWYNFILSQQFVTNVFGVLPEEARVALLPVVRSRRSVDKSPVPVSNNQNQVNQRNQEGKFVDLPGAEMGKVVVRFPPEASGYLHIGHAKAALLNQYYQEAFKGKLIMRFDDTNPAKENVHFEQVILEDLEMLEIKPDEFTHTSNYFDLMLDYCERLLKENKAYVDDTEPEKMKQEREQKHESMNRSNTITKNLEMWQEMKLGTNFGQKCCVRAKIDMQSPNGCMRDPTIYRCKNELHPRTGDKYKVYPTYDFACPIVDAIEGVTHTLRTMEYHDRDAQFYWFIEALGLRRPYIWEYSRLSMTNTVLSKRKLTWFVQEGLVDGWDDPRFPTVRGVLRRGMSVEGLKQFIIAQGSSRSVVFMEWDKIWAFNKKVIDPIAPRYTALDYKDPVPVLVEGVQPAALTVAKHPKNTDVGMKTVWVGPRILIDRIDAETLKENENTTFINWGNLLIKKINRENGKIVSVNAVPNLDNKDYKKTLKLTWLCETEQAPFTPCYCVYFDHIISKPLLGKDEDFKQYIGHETRKEVRMLGDPELKHLKKGDIIQLQRCGFFKVDVAYEPANDTCFKERPIILFSIPDGHVKDNPITAATKQTSNVQFVTKTKSASEINKEIVKQGEKVRDLKSKKSDKATIDSEVKILLALKSEYKQLTGNDWKPEAQPKANTQSNENDLNTKITAHGDKIRLLKSQKSDKATIDSEVKVLLSLKTEYKQLIGKDWTPGVAQPVKKDTKCVDLSQKITSQGDKVRKLKSEKADKTVLDAEVKILLNLKTEYKNLTGTDWKPSETPLATGNVSAVSQKIISQGDKIRKLKSEKADKTVLDAEVKILLNLKTEYKNLTGSDWKPSETPLVTGNVSAVSQKIISQGDKIRKLKSEKADKTVLDAEVKILLNLKSEYKNLTGSDWKPSETPSATGNVSAVSQKITSQGDKIRKLKSEKADKTVLDGEVKILLNLKSDYKNLTGTDWIPSTMATNEVKSNDELTPKITEQGNIVRNLKSSGASKESIDSAVKTLLNLKAEYKKVTGTDFPSGAKTTTKSNAAPTKKALPVKEKNTKPTVDKSSVGDGVKKQTRLGLETRKEENLAEWYSQVLTKGELIEYYDVSGCYIYRPWSYAIWETLKEWFDFEIKKLGVQNCYFPIFVSKSVLEKEKSHIADFAPEVAWVTKSGDSELAEPVAIRPTSETVMYPAYAKWIQSYRDLPIKLNQWNNIVRWEFKHPVPFLRTREFLWQEGHTAYATKEEATNEVATILDLYGRIYTDLLAIPVVKGRKTEKEKFAGGDFTYTVEAYVGANGRAIQGATSHHLGQNFSKMFDVTFEDPDTQEKKYVYQNSWGFTTRTIGVMIMVHADNQGLVLPPRVASVQVVIVPCGITVSLNETDKTALQNECDALERELNGASVRVKGDYRDNYSPGWKFNHWELKGVPIRVELGPKDVKNNQLVAVRRDTGEKLTIKRVNAVQELTALLETIHKNLYDKASKELKEHTVQLTDWSQFTPNLDKKNIILVPFCGDGSCEDNIKADSARGDAELEPGAPSMGAKSLCIPLEQSVQVKATDKCIHPRCQRKPQFYTLFGRSY